MKKKKISLESHFWTVHKIENPFKILEAMFDFTDIEHYKRLIGEVVEYVYTRKVYCMETRENCFFTIKYFVLL